MVLGARDVDSHGLLLMYRSTDLKDWTLFDRLTMPDFGYMWECPDLFELDGELFLVFSPQGLEAKGWDNRNVYQTGYCRLDYDFDTKEYAFSLFQELDRGFDYYAPQSFLDEQGRRIQFGWMGMGDAPYTNAPTIERGWQHALTLPRELRAKDGHLYQTPIVEIEQLRQEKYESSIADFADPGFGKSYENDRDVCAKRAVFNHGGRRGDVGLRRQRAAADDERRRLWTRRARHRDRRGEKYPPVQRHVLAGNFRERRLDGVLFAGLFNRRAKRAHRGARRGNRDDVCA